MTLTRIKTKLINSRYQRITRVVSGKCAETSQSFPRRTTTTDILLGPRDRISRGQKEKNTKKSKPKHENRRLKVEIMLQPIDGTELFIHTFRKNKDADLTKIFAFKFI